MYLLVTVPSFLVSAILLNTENEYSQHLFKGLAAVSLASLYEGIVYQDIFSAPKMFDIIALKHAKKSKAAKQMYKRKKSGSNVLIIAFS